MEIQDLVKGLHSKTSRKILQLLCDKDRTAVEIYGDLKGDAPKFRQSVNRALEVLRRHKLIKKYYDENRKALYYRIVKSDFHIDLKNMSVE